MRDFFWRTNRHIVEKEPEVEVAFGEGRYTRAATFINRLSTVLVDEQESPCVRRRGRSQSLITDVPLLPPDFNHSVVKSSSLAVKPQNNFITMSPMFQKKHNQVSSKRQRSHTFVVDGEHKGKPDMRLSQTFSYREKPKFVKELRKSKREENSKQSDNNLKQNGSSKQEGSSKQNGNSKQEDSSKQQDNTKLTLLLEHRLFQSHIDKHNRRNALCEITESDRKVILNALNLSLQTKFEKVGIL